jgi:hypothetical protein
MESLDEAFNTSVAGDDNCVFGDTDTPVGSSMPFDSSSISAQFALLQESLHPTLPASPQQQQGVEENHRQTEVELDSESRPQEFYLSHVQALSRSSSEQLPDFSLIKENSMFASSLKWILPTAASLASCVFSSSDDDDSLDDEPLSNFLVDRKMPASKEGL